MRPASHSRPTFFWQGLLILMPILLLAGLGLLSLGQDRRLAEEDARQRAREMVRQMAPAIAESVGNQMLQFERDAILWDNWRAPWRPQAPSLLTMRTLPLSETRATEWAAAWMTAHANLNPDDALLSRALVTDQGDCIVPRLWVRNPVPPEWWSAIPLAQHEEWESARALEARGAPEEEIRAVWGKLLAGGIGAEARAAANLALLRLELSTNAADAGINRLAQFSQEHENVASETGLPLCAVALMAALNRGVPLNELLLQAAARQLVLAPSLLAPYFIAECERRGAAAPESVKAALPALRKLWDREERLRELVAGLRQRVGQIQSLNSNVWLSAGGVSWLAVPHPRHYERRSPRSGEAERVDEVGTSIFFLPKPALEAMMEEALRGRQTSWASYLEVQPALEGEAMGAPRHGETLAEESGVVNPSVSVGVKELDSAGKQWESQQESPAWLAPPRFVLTACLSAPGELYARQRTRTLWFGGLIAAVTAAAVVGFIRARRAFWREHQLSELKTNFVSSVSHELRAPIASVRLMAESLERGKVEDPARQREYFRFMVQECRRLTSLVANVLDFARIEQGRKEYEFEPTAVAELVRQTMRLMEPHAVEREVALVESVPSTGGQFQPVVDGRALQQALVNLLDNALKHSPTRATVTIGLQPSAGAGESGRWRLWVQDQGPGIPASEQERIFERFYRLGSELRRDTQGVGIGLSIVKHIVEAHGGRVMVESAPGQGSLFIMEFPGHE